MRIFEAPYRISDPVGNNRFGQADASRPLPLEVPSRISGTLDDVRTSDRIAFREFDETGRLVEANGLERFVSTHWNGIPLHVVDNHNCVLAFWLEAVAEGVLPSAFAVAHVDMHSDLWPNPNDLDLSAIGNAGYVETFTHLKSEVGNYVDPALRCGLVDRFVRIEGESDLLRDSRALGSGGYDGVPLVLNLDLDFFAPELDDVPFELKKSVILGFARKARIITVATSPVFVEQDLAIRRLREIFG